MVKRIDQKVGCLEQKRSLTLKLCSVNLTRVAKIGGDKELVSLCSLKNIVSRFLLILQKKTTESGATVLMVAHGAYGI